jgi:hypothetical protein
MVRGNLYGLDVHENVDVQANTYTCLLVPWGKTDGELIVEVLEYIGGKVI